MELVNDKDLFSLKASATTNENHPVQNPFAIFSVALYGCHFSDIGSCEICYYLFAILVGLRDVVVVHRMNIC